MNSDPAIREAQVLLTNDTSQDHTLRKILHFLQTSEVPEFSTPAARYKFLKKCQWYFVKEGLLYKQFDQCMPARVVLDIKERQRILKEAHEHLGQRRTGHF
ncbi:hypothetical protein BV20DRAFT_944540 [Pilatotrama ljubarskyi]|nr:hypothetical protein BV20DRAFT_944540 [Pilatotrama ljubarskyi]